MLAKYENRLINKDKVWVGKWLNLTNNTHWHDETEIVFCTQGKVTVDVQNQSFILSKNECVFLEGGLIHRIVSEEGSVCITVIIHDSIASFVSGRYHLKNRKLTQTLPLINFYNQIRQLQRENSPFFSNSVIAHTILLLTQIFENEDLSEQPLTPLKNNRYDLFKQILQTIEEDYSFITFNDACKKFGYSPAHFSRLFMHFTGTTFTKYLTSVRISKAVELLQSETNLSVTEVATFCGFSSIRNFNRYFKQYTGFSPRELPKQFTLQINSFKHYGAPFDPTNKTSVLLD